MPTSSPPSQSELWNGSSGLAWVDTQPILDAMFQPLEQRLTEAAAADAAAHPHRVLDVGCGTGATTLALAAMAEAGAGAEGDRGGAFGDCLGIDISAPMLALARARADQRGLHAARFVRADAQTHDFAPAGFELIQSRFGVMFFDDPRAAFANLRRAAAPGARLRFIAWRPADENPFMTTAERAAAPLLPALPARDPARPGQFAFGDPERMIGILHGAGWERIEIAPLDAACALPERDLPTYALRLGPVGQQLREADARTRAQVIETVCAAFAPFLDGDMLRYRAACWWVEARAPR
ncbi:class I SAM-dependent methyltransferase [Burkholderia gladioli]|uniref:class I SAM-dependent methyltransferase n=1 Tax=Burkholderia gladioli TaxID=28095 RepID=UPI00163ED425|nr:class I SAM-dependent methyltransferase [Burkholderia gladioli]